MQAGRLRYRVTIDRRVDAQDADGDTVTTWVPLAGIPVEGLPAEIVPLSARELLAAGATQSEEIDRITIRWTAGITDGITTAMRVRRLDDGRLYNIRGAPADNRSGREWITIVGSCGPQSYAS
jgi:SPP1 family predicted phage head-tail adaptor